MFWHRLRGHTIKAFISLPTFRVLERVCSCGKAWRPEGEDE